MREFCISRKEKYTWARNLCMIDMLIATGMRAVELIHANLEDYKNSTLHIRSKKGEKDRTVPLPGKLTADIKFHSIMNCLRKTSLQGGWMVIYQYNFLRRINQKYLTTTLKEK